MNNLIIYKVLKSDELYKSACSFDRKNIKVTTRRFKQPFTTVVLFLLSISKSLYETFDFIPT